MYAFERWYAPAGWVVGKIVGIATALGHIVRTPAALLGATLLAWGMSDAVHG